MDIKLLKRQILKYVVILFVLSLSILFIYLVSLPILILLFLVYDFLLTSYPIVKNTLIYVTIFSIPTVVIYHFYNHFRKDLLQMIKDEMNDIGTLEQINIDSENSNEDYERLRKIFLKSKIKLGLGKDWPIKLYVATDYKYMNAFAISNYKNESIVVLSNNMRELTNRQIQSIIGHEIGHILNRDTLFKVLQYSALSSIETLSKISTRLLETFTSYDKGGLLFYIIFNSGSIIFTIILFLINFVMPIFKYIIAISNRQAEYIADQYGANSTSKENMIQALEALTSNEVDESVPLLARMLNEHPETYKRIDNLKIYKD